MLNNRDLNQVTWEQRIMTGDIKFEASQDLPDFPYAQFAESIGPARASAWTTPTSSRDAWDRALSQPTARSCSRRSPTRTCRRFRRTSRSSRRRISPMSLLKGDPDEGGIVKQAVKGMVQSLIPH